MELKSKNNEFLGKKKERKAMENNKLIIPELNTEAIESMIFMIRGQKVILDFELAKIYGYTTKAFRS